MNPRCELQTPLFPAKKEPGMKPGSKDRKVDAG
jgi:hypothetical protein